MHRLFRLSSLALAATVFPASARGQSESFCSNAADSSRVISTGPVRMVAQAFGDLRLCLTARGFTDSADVHPREWSGFATDVTFETIRPGDNRRLESSPQRSLMTINGQPRAVDSAVAAWREQVYAVVEARWNIVSLRQQRSDLENDIIATRRTHAAILAEIDTLQHQAAGIDARIAALQAEENSLRARLSREERMLNDIRSQISQERNAMAAVQPTTPEAAIRLRAAEQRVRRLEEQERRQDMVVRSVERRLLEVDASRRTGILTLSRRDLNPEARIDLLRVRLAELDADARVEGLNARITSLRAEQRLRTLEAQLEQAVGRLDATLRR